MTMENLPARTSGAGPLADYSVGMHVQTKEGYPGVIDDILEGPADLTTYWVTLDNGLGGGEYAEAEIWPLAAQQTASQMASEAGVERTAADDYPVLEEILAERLPPQITTTAGAAWTHADDPDYDDDLNYPALQHTPEELAAWEEHSKERQETFRRNNRNIFEKARDRLLHRGSAMVHCTTCDVDYPIDSEDEKHDHSKQAAEAALKLALYLPPKPPSEQASSTTPLDPQEKQGFREGFEHGKEGLTRAPSLPLDAQYMAGYDLGWAEGVLVYRKPPDAEANTELEDAQIAGTFPDALGPMRGSADTSMLEHLQQMEARGGMVDLGMPSVHTPTPHEAGAFLDWISGNPNPSQHPDPNFDRTHSYDYCRFRKDSHCWLSKDLNEEASKQAGYAVWNPVDRGYCFRVKWEDQQKCPVGAPGPNVAGGFTDATTPWDQGGQRGGTPTNMMTNPNGPEPVTGARQTYFHGSNTELASGDLVSPASQTGAKNWAEQLGLDSTDPKIIGPHYSRDRIYLTTDRIKAMDFGNYVYEVEPTAVVQADPEAMGEPWFYSGAPARVVRKVIDHNRAVEGAKTIDMTPPLPEAWEGPGVYEVDMTGRASTGCVAYYTMAMGMPWPVAWLSWDKTKRTIEGVWVMDDNRGKGLGAHLLEQAAKVAGGPLVDSGEHTNLGYEWAKKRGLNPKRKIRTPDNEMSRMNVQMNDALIGGGRIVRKVGSHEDSLREGSYAHGDLGEIYRTVSFGSETPKPSSLGEAVEFLSHGQRVGIMGEGMGIHWTANPALSDQYVEITNPGEWYLRMAATGVSIADVDHDNSEADWGENDYGFEQEVTLVPTSPVKVTKVEIWSHEDPHWKTLPGSPVRATASIRVEATWADVRNKAKRIRASGGVRVVASHNDEVVAHVKGDHGIYETTLRRNPGSRSNVAYWHCGCKWAAYSWGRSPAYKRFEGRMCSHALALQYEAQSRNMFGREMTLDEKQPAWMDQKHIHLPGDYRRDLKRYTHLVSASAATFFARVRGVVQKVLLDQDGPKVGGSKVSSAEVLYPNWHPSKGLNPNDNSRLSTLQTEASGTDLKAAAKAMLEMARRNEPDTTTMLAAEALTHGGEMFGLDYRFKSEASLLRKMEAETHEFGGDAGMTAINMSDTLRYTMLLPDGNYTRGAEQVLDDLKEAGYGERVKNYWERGDSYQGLNAAMMTPRGHPFELQFHTPESIDMKERVVHPLYEKWRVESNPEKKAAYAYEMRDAFDSIPVPSGILSIPTLTRQPMPEPKAAALDDTHKYLRLHYLHGGATTTVIRLDDNGVVEVWKDGKWVEDSHYGRYFFKGEARSDEITPAEAEAFTSGKTSSLTKTADEDQCPRCSEDSCPNARRHDGVIPNVYDCPSCGARFMGHEVLAEVPFADLPEVSYDHPFHPITPAHGSKTPTKEGSKMDIPDEFGSLFDDAVGAAPLTGGIQPIARQQEWDLDVTSGFLGTLDEEPEPALPTTDGADEEEAARTAARLLAAQAARPAPPAPLPPQERRPMAITHTAGFPLCAYGCNQTLSAADALVNTTAGLAHANCPRPVSDPVTTSQRHETPEERGRRLLAYVDASMSGQEVSGPNPFEHLTAGQSDNEMKQAAERFLTSEPTQRTALKSYDLAERNAIINEGEGTEATNLDRLDLTSTHYEILEQERQAKASLPDDEDLWMLDGDPNGPD